MRKLIALITAMVFVLGSTVPAGAEWGVDVTNVLSAEADLATGVDNLYLMPMPQLKDTATGANVAGSKIKWTYQAGKTWKIANEYLEISYKANLVGWGIQIYTDNKNGTPKWVERPDPTNAEVDRPAGLVGDGSVNFIAIPLAWKAFPGGDYGKPAYKDGSGFGTDTEYRTDYTEPKERAFGDSATDKYYIELYQYSPDATAAKPKLYGKYCWVLDKGSQKWIDANDDKKLSGRDTDGDGKANYYDWFDTNLNYKLDAGEGEITSIFEDNDGNNEPSDKGPHGQDDITIVNYLGTSTCTYDSLGTFIYRDACASPVYLVLAAKIAVGSIKAKYITTTLTLELYHE